MAGVVWMLTLCISCQKFTEIDSPYTHLSPEFVFATDAAAEGALNGLFGKLQSAAPTAGGLYSISHVAALSSDELVSTSQSNSVVQLGTNSILPNNEAITLLWTEMYNMIYATNSILEGVGQSATMSPQKKKQCEGEAKFVRAFCYFYLVNLMGDVPLIKTTDYRINTSAARNSSDEVYRLITQDLLDAKGALEANYVSGPLRLRPNRSTVSALLARVYLYQKKYADAEREASEVIVKSDLYQLEPILTDVFLSNSREANLQVVMPEQASNNIVQAELYLGDLYKDQWHLSSSLLSSFEGADKRKQLWTGELMIGGNSYINPRKYLSVTANNDREAYIFFRLAEQYLIRAEARAFQGNLDPVTGALSDLNKIRDRAGLGMLTGLTQSQAIVAIDTENRHEYFSEWGHRWLDMKRRGTVNTIMSAHRPTTWQATDALYPIRRIQIDNNPNTTQNPGYR